MIDSYSGSAVSSRANSSGGSIQISCRDMMFPLAKPWVKLAGTLGGMISLYLESLSEFGLCRMNSGT